MDSGASVRPPGNNVTLGGASDAMIVAQVSGTLREDESREGGDGLLNVNLAPYSLLTFVRTPLS
jgi:hypothetical protein